MDFNYITDTEILIDNEKHIIRMGNGMTGLGSRTFWLDGIENPFNIVTQSADITKGNHFLYVIKLTPFDKAYILIHEDEVSELLSDANKWREPELVNTNKGDEFTGFFDDTNKPIFVGDKLKSEWGYEVIVIKDEDGGYSGKLVCEDSHSCKNIPYDLHEGKGYKKTGGER